MTAMPTIPLDLERGLDGLYERDEVAWYDAMATLIGQGRTEELDFANLREILEDMGKRFRREVKSRLRILLAHWLKWEYQPDQRTGGWKATLLIQRSDLKEDLTDSGTLYNHALEVYGEAYTRAVKLAAAETGLPPETFPTICPVTLDELLAE
jgi:Domain of unknown function DUF29